MLADKTSPDIQLLVVALGDNNAELGICIDCSEILEIVEPTKLSTLPGGAHPFVGILTLRGQPIPVLELATLVQQPHLGETDPERLVICQVQAGKVALNVRGTLSIRLISQDEIAGVPASLQEHARAISCPRIVRTDNMGHILILDVNAALSGLLLSRSEAA